MSSHEFTTLLKASNAPPKIVFPLIDDIWKTRDGRLVYITKVVNSRDPVIRKPIVGCFITKENKLSNVFFSWSLDGKYGNTESGSDLIEKTNNINIFYSPPAAGEIWKMRCGELALIQEISVGVYPYVGICLKSNDKNFPIQLRWRYNEKQNILEHIDTNFDLISFFE